MSSTLGPPEDDFEPTVAPTDPLEQSLIEADAGLEPVAAPPPVYRMMPDSRVPVSSKRGSVWKSRKDNAQKQMGDLMDAWNEAIRYYNHDQSGHRDGASSPDYSGNRHTAAKLNEKHTSTENIVFANVNAQIPELYAKNPIITVAAMNDHAPPSSAKQTPDAPEHTTDDFARAVELLVNVLFNMKTAPGINLKPKAKRNVLLTLLTNRSWFEVGYITKDKSSDQAQNDLLALSDRLKEAKDANEIKEIEGALMALEEKIEFLQPSGPFARIRMPHQVTVDPDHNDPYLSDANWVIIEDMLPTEYINAVFGERDPDKPDGEVRSVFEPTHILNEGSGDNTTEDGVSLFSKDGKNDYNAYGFDSQQAYDKAKRTKVNYVWDKTTRRLEMYADNDWKWPIWVWDDPYQLQGFFPLTPMWFHDNPTAVFAKGEVSYYLDQQDQINEINDEKRRALLWARRNIFYNPDTGITQDIADAVLSGNRQQATPIRVPEGVDPLKMVFSIPPPSMAFGALFEKTDLYASVDRIAATNEVERGGQFKTNTTNKAIDYYSTMGNMRMDMRLDSIEDAIGDVGWKVAQLCLRFMSAETVKQLIGLDVSPFWLPIDPLNDYTRLSVSVVGGSTQKITSQARKQEAVQVGQVLSQYVKAAPAAVLKTTLSMMSKAFDDVMVSKEDWEAIAAEVERTLVAGQGGAPGLGASGGGSAPPPSGGPPMPGGAPDAGGAQPMQVAQMIVQGLSQLPPQMLQAIGQALAQGVPPAQIFQQMLAAQGGGAPPPQAGAV